MEHELPLTPETCAALLLQNAHVPRYYLQPNFVERSVRRVALTVNESTVVLQFTILRHSPAL